MLTSHDTVANKFYDGWQHPKTRPTIRNIFYVAYSGAGLTHLGKFSDYRYLSNYLSVLIALIGWTVTKWEILK